MKISSYNSTPYFGAKHQDVRNADDIARKSNQEFPAFHPSYATSFYRTLNPETEQGRANKRKFLMNCARKFFAKVRMPSEKFETMNNGAVPYSGILKILKQEKLANCKECVIATLATLYANGYYNSIPVGLNFDYEFFDKNTGEVKLKGSDEIDHALVLSDMNNPKRRGDVKKCIVVDSWLNYAADVQSADVKYATVFSKQIDEKLFSLAKEHNIDVENTQVRFHPFYTISGYEQKKSAKQIGDWAKEQYPSIVIEKDSK